VARLKSFYCPLKQNLDDFRNGVLTLEQMVSYIYSIDNSIYKKITTLQNIEKEKRESEFNKYKEKWKRRD
tara:strand:+ start:124 stop:333 length:210 start_codon:yes stop_codon:yes gene_type:complete